MAAGVPIYSQLIRAQFQNLSSDPSATATGLFYYHTSSNVVKWYSGSAWKTAVDTDSTQTIAGKTFTTNSTLFQSSSGTARRVQFDIDDATNSTTATLDFNQTGNRTYSWPDASMTIVGEGTTQTLTDKTLTSPVINTATIASSNATTFFGLLATAELRYYDTDSSNYTGFKAPGTIASNAIYTLPNAFPASNLLLQSTSLGVLSWVAAAVTPSTAGGVYSDGSLLQSIAFSGNANKVFGVNNAANSMEAKAFAVGTSGTDFAVAHSAGTITFNLPDASGSNRGAVTTIAQTFTGIKSHTSAALFADGTNANASIGFINDPDTGIYRSGSDSIGFTAGGTAYGELQGASGTWVFGNATATSTHLIQSTTSGDNFVLEVNRTGGNTGKIKLRSNTAVRGEIMWSSTEAFRVNDASSNQFLAIDGSTGAFSVLHQALNIWRFVGVTSGTGAQHRFLDGSGDTCGQIVIDATANTTSYATSSDARLKHQFAAFSGLSIVMALVPKEYERHSNPGVKEHGLVAQDAQGVYPQAVLPGGDNPTESPWMVDYQKLVPVLLRAVQELKDEFDAYKDAHP